MHLVGFIIRIYHDSRSSERQITQSETSEDGPDFKVYFTNFIFISMLVTDTNPCSLTSVTALGYVSTEY